MSLVISHETQLVQKPKRVFFTANAQLLEGMGVCYDADRTETNPTVAATDRNAKRDNHVEVPTTSNNRNFAGVAAETYSAQSGGRWITIYEPGSYCMVAVGGEDTVVNVTRLTCSAGGPVAGRFDAAGLRGRGTALMLQTVDVVIAAATIDGGGSITSQTVTDTGEFANAAVGDFMVIKGGGDATTGNAATLPALQKITTVTDNDNVIIDGTVADGDAISYYVMNGENPKCQAYLETGEESGLQEWINPIDNVAVQSMVGGMTHIGGGGLTFGADSSSTLADPTILGELKGFFCHGVMTTNDYVVTVTSGLKLVGTSLANLNFNAVGESALLQGGSSIWKNIAGEGVAEG